MKNLALYGFGRINRRLLRLMSEEQRARVVAISDIADARTMAHLFAYDSIHGRFEGTVEIDGDAVVVDGQSIRFFQQSQPGDDQWSSLGVDVVIDSVPWLQQPPSGVVHLENGARKVVLTGAALEPDLVLVRGVNDDSYDPDLHRFISIGTGMDNLVAPIASVLSRSFGVNRAHITALLANSPDQPVLDSPRNNLYRCRGGPQNVVPSLLAYSASGVGKVIPELMGKITTGLGYRVPISCGYLADMAFDLPQPADGLAVRKVLLEASEGPLEGVLGVTDDPIVSSDVIEDTRSCVVDANWISTHDDRVIFSAWQDNESACAFSALKVAELVS